MPRTPAFKKSCRIFLNLRQPNIEAVDLCNLFLVCVLWSIGTCMGKFGEGVMENGAISKVG